MSAGARAPATRCVDAGGSILAVDLVRSLPLDRLLDVVGCATVVEARRAQRALRALLS